MPAGSASPLRIGIDALVLRPGGTGGAEVFMRRFIAALGRVDRRNAYTIYATSRGAALLSGLPDNFRIAICPLPGGRLEIPMRLAWEWTVLRAQARRDRLDVMHFPFNIMPPRFPRPTVLTVHDFSSLFYRERMGGRHGPSRRLLDYLRVRSCARADRLAADSRFTADEIAARTSADPADVSVVHLAGREFSVPSLGSARETVARYGVPERYWLVVATLSLHKNIPRLLKAYAALGDVDPPPLVLVGRAGRGADVLTETIGTLNLDDRVIRTGYVPDEDVPAFYRAAELFLFPSLYEGFGLPMLEAGACGTPILAANAGSLPEIGGDAAAYFDPWDVDDIAAALRRALASPELRRELGSRGPARAARFSWDTTAEQMVSLYEAAAAG